ncbi:hypothetical protein HDV03_001547 [Kappamyces sp. JEL0829]|nr:hypothetical protein HDV03_001547 [Kappamyces sp. JEL0829]
MEKSGKKNPRTTRQPLADQSTSVAPIVLALLPSVLSSLTGISWTEYLVLGLVLFYLYMILKVPGDLLIQARNHLTHAQDVEQVKFWKRRESNVLALYTLAPLLGGLGLFYTQSLLQSSLLSHFSVSLFLLSAFIRPFLYFKGLVEVDVPGPSLPSLSPISLKDLTDRVQELKKDVQSLQQGLDKQIQDHIKAALEPLVKTVHSLKKRGQQGTPGLASASPVDTEKMALVENRILHVEETLEVLFSHIHRDPSFFVDPDRTTPRAREGRLANIPANLKITTLFTALLKFYEWTFIKVLSYPLGIYKSLSEGGASPSPSPRPVPNFYSYPGQTTPSEYGESEAARSHVSYR